MTTKNHITKVQKRNGDIVEFVPEKIFSAVFKAITATKQGNGKKTQQIAESVIKILNRRFKKDEVPNVEQIQDIVEEVLILEGEAIAAKGFILYREQRRIIRESQLIAEEAVDRVDDYLDKLDWEVQENSNMTFSLQGLNHYGVSYIVKKYWLNKVYPSEVREANQSGDIHLHNLDTLACYCVGWDLYDLLLRGFGGVNGKIESSPPKHFRSALGQVVNFMYTLQGEAAGAVSFSNFDTLLAPFIRYDNLSYPQVEQAIQEFLYNMAVPTRVGFQCLSEDTEILTCDGWMGHEDVKEGDEIKTFNLNTGEIEDKKVLKMFKRDYKGEMYNLKNRIQDQLISPEHRVVRKAFNSNNFVLESIEDVSKLKSPFIIPIAGENNKKDAKISDEQIKLMAWIIAEGTIEKPGDNYRSCYRVSIYQSKIKNKKSYDEIISLLDYFNLKYSIYSSASLGDKVERMRLDANSSKKIHGWFTTRDNVHFIPDILLNMSQRQSQLFLETYLKADGTEDCKIATTDGELLNGLQAITVSAGYGFTVRERKPTIGKKIIYILRLIKHKETYIQTIKKVKYDGIIWCPTTKNETVIARRNGKVFITGNCPFTNVTLDLKPAVTFANQSVIVGGIPQKETYSEFEEEMKMLDKAFYTAMIKGDKSGRPFSFPIPTINITPDFPWDDPALDPLFEASAKYGINYFANYINSDMKPEDARSMCLHPDETILIKEDNNIKKFTIEEIFKEYKGDKIDNEWFETKNKIEALSLNPDTGKFEWVSISKFLKITDNKIIKITAKDGKTMRVSADHLVAVFNKNGIATKKAKDLDLDDLVLVIKDASNILNKKSIIEDDLAWFMGLFMADGNYLYDSRYEKKVLRGVQISFNKKETDLINRTKKFIKEYLNYDMKFILDPRYDNSLRGYIYNSEFANSLKNNYDLRKYNKLPNWIWSSNVDTITNFIEGFFDGDGYENGKEIHINDENLAVEINLLIQLIGISTTLRYKENSQVIRLQHVLGRGSENNKIIKDKLHNLIPQFLMDKKYVKEEGGNNIYQSYGSKMVGLSTIDRWNLSNDKIESLRNSDYAVTEIDNIEKEDLDYQQEFYDVELEKNHYFVHSDGNITHNCCRLRLDMTQLANRGGGGLFGSGSLTGSIGVVTINLPRIGYLSKTKKEFFERLERMMEIARESLEIKRKTIEEFTSKGLYPYSKYYLAGVKKAKGQYFANHFSTIGICGMNEALLNFMGEDIGSKKGRSFTIEVMDFMRSVLVRYQNETNNIYNLEATPAESTSYRFAQKDRKIYPDIIALGTKKVPYYTNSTQLPVNYTDDIFEEVKLQDDIQCKYTGGTVEHIFIGEELSDIGAVKSLVKKVFEKNKLPYITVTPTFSICPTHGYIAGKHFNCPKCAIEQPCEVYSRVVGYLRPVTQWNEGKQQEFKDRKEFKKSLFK